MQQGLALARSARWVSWLAVPFNLRNMSPDSLPSPDLARVLFRRAAAHIVAAVPLEPTSRIVGVNPSLLTPDG